MKTRLYYPMWLDNTEMLGTLDKSDASDGRDPVVLIDRQGGIKSRLTGRSVDRRDWFRIGVGSPTCIVVEYSHNTGGDDPRSWFMDVHTGKTEDLSESDVVAIAPDGKRCAMTKQEWTGPYKRGGRRLGPLEIVDLTTKQATPITSDLINIWGGDWRKSK